MPPPRGMVIRWEILSAVDIQQAAKFSLEVVLGTLDGPQHIRAAFSNVQVVDETPNSS